nr:hypothetical protein [Tanacetum cinerariifolium]
ASKVITRKSETSEEKAAKKQKLDEEVKELKTHLQIVPNNEDDVEDLEMLWKIIQERFAFSEPKNFSDDFLLYALNTMFEKPNFEASIWKNQRGRYRLAKVKSWKLLYFRVDAVEDFKEYMLRDYYSWLKTYCCMDADRGNEVDSSLSDIGQIFKDNENVDTNEFMDEILNSQEDPNTRKQEKGKGIEKNSPPPTPIRSPRTHIVPISSDKETLLDLTVSSKDAPSSSDKEKLEELTVDSFLRNCMSNNILHVHSAQASMSSARDLQDHEDHHDDDARPEGESSTKRQKTSKNGTYSVGESSSEQVMDQEPNPSGLGTQEQLDKFGTWMDKFGKDDDEVPTKGVSQEI